MKQKTVFAGNDNNQYGADMILRESSDFYGQALRTLDARSVSGYYSHFRATYDVSNNPTTVSYYRGTKAYRTSIEFTAAATLNSKYFVIHSAPDNQLWVVWYNVDGLGVVPVVANAKFIQVSLVSSDTAEMVAAITKITLDNLYSQVFVAGTRNANSLQILTNGLGEVDGSFDVNTGFSITGTNGEQELVEELVIDYQGTDPLFEGQVLKGYEFDIYSGKFFKNPEVQVDVGNVGIADSDGDELEVNVDGSINVNVVSTGQQLYSYFNEVDNVATGITTELVTYTAVTDVFLQKIEFCGTNIAEFELTIDDVTFDKKRTFFNGNLENKFDFNQGLNIAPGQVIKVYVVHTRPELGLFSARTQILQG